jgi:hypothetical protein
MVIQPGQGTQVVVWEIGTTRAWAFSASGPCTYGIGDCGHDGLGYSNYYAANPYLNSGVYLWAHWEELRLGTLTPMLALVSNVMSQYRQENQNYDYHISANAGSHAANFDDAPILVSTEYNFSAQGVGIQPAALSPYQNEIVGLCTICTTPVVWRFAHTEYSYDAGVSPCCGPTADISQDGNWASFTSNWADTRGTTSQGAYRTDVFTVNLRSARPAGRVGEE